MKKNSELGLVVASLNLLNTQESLVSFRIGELHRSSHNDHGNVDDVKWFR